MDPFEAVPSRAEVLVAGGGVAGICAAVSAARAGAVVHLTDDSADWGWDLKESILFGAENGNSCLSSFPRESGIMDELLLYLARNNPEGTYAGQCRCLRTFLRREPRLNSNTHQILLQARLGKKRDRIESILVFDRASARNLLLRADFFVDCTVNSSLMKLSKAPGENGFDRQKSDPAPISAVRSLAVIEVSRKDAPCSFSPPEWLESKWEENAIEAKMEWMQSLENSLVGLHRLKWIDSGDRRSPTAEQLAWTAWDYLKNRSPLKDSASNLAIERVEGIESSALQFQAQSGFSLTEDGVARGDRHLDSVALCRFLPLGETGATGKSGPGLPYPIEIPLRSLYSNGIKNLFFSGNSAASPRILAESLSHPSTSSQIGEAIGYCAWFCLCKKRLPRTICKPGHIEELKRNLEHALHRTSWSELPDDSNLAAEASVTASSAWQDVDVESLSRRRGKNGKACLMKFPLSSDRIKEIRVMVEAEREQAFQARLLAGSSWESCSPGPCVGVGDFEAGENGGQWIAFRLDVKGLSPGWHYLEIKSDQPFRPMESLAAPVGFGMTAPPSEPIGKPSSRRMVATPIMRISPEQNLFSPEEVIHSSWRPSHRPNLWVSQPTDFTYPEFLELSWQKPVCVSSIELCFDPDYERGDLTQLASELAFPDSLVKDYRIYTIDPTGKSKLLLEELDNELTFRIHSFDELSIRGMELEILSTHGLNRAQVYRIAVRE